MQGIARVDTDYLVIGAGAVAMAFVDTLIENPEADVIMVDSPAPGGHWLDSYPYVQLHQPSANYGVNSTPLGHDRVEPDGPEPGLLRASGRHRDLRLLRPGDAAPPVGLGPGPLLPHERVPRRPKIRILSMGTGVETDVSVRGQRTVDATYMASRVPATEPPPFEVVDGATCVPLGAALLRRHRPSRRLRDHRRRFRGAMDVACFWLLDQGASPATPSPGSARGKIVWQPLNRGSSSSPTRALSPRSRGSCWSWKRSPRCDTIEEVYERLEERLRWCSASTRRCNRRC